MQTESYSRMIQLFNSTKTALLAQFILMAAGIVLIWGTIRWKTTSST